MCDFSAQKVTNPPSLSDHVSSHGDSDRGGKQKFGKVVRNRTILGSFPLFFKLSQSLSSLNSVSTLNNNYSSLGRASTRCSR